MNIFACDTHPQLAARALTDRHVVKMCLESAQLLSTAARLTYPDADHAGLYKAAYVNHPVTRWVLASRHNRLWLGAHAVALCSEYWSRFGREHASRAVINRAIGVMVEDSWRASEVPSLTFCGPADLAPTEPGNDAVVAAYRALLRRKYAAWTADGKPPKWTNSSKPAWLEEA